jgi:large subunit ribosomal protein L27
MAHKKATGSAKRTVNVPGKRLGIKKFGGEYVKAGNIIVRQRGTKFHPGVNTMVGRDHTIFAVSEGFVAFRGMTGYKRNQKYVDVVAQSPHQPVEKKAARKVAAKSTPKSA